MHYRISDARNAIVDILYFFIGCHLGRDNVWLDFFLFLLYFSLSLALPHLIGSQVIKLKSSRETSTVKNNYYDEAFRGHERTNATPRRWGVAVVAV